MFEEGETEQAVDTLAQGRGVVGRAGHGAAVGHRCGVAVGDGRQWLCMNMEQRTEGD